MFGVANMETTFRLANVVSFVVRAGIFVDAAFFHRVRLRFVALWSFLPAEIKALHPAL